MFRMQNNVPPIYVEESRDFQLLVRLIDVLNNGVHFDTQSMTNVVNPMTIKSEFLGLLSTKMGFFPNRDINEETLRYILSAFPYIMKNKGTLQGINGAVASVLKAEKQPDAVGDFEVEIINSITDVIGEQTITKDVYQINIFIPVTMTYNKIALEELLRYVIPTGYDVRIQEYTQQPARVLANITTDDKTQNLYLNSVKTSGVRGYFDYEGVKSDEMKRTLTGAYDVSEVVSGQMYDKQKDNSTYGDEQQNGN